MFSVHNKEKTLRIKKVKCLLMCGNILSKRSVTCGFVVYDDRIHPQALTDPPIMRMEYPVTPQVFHRARAAYPNVDNCALGRYNDARS